MSTIKPASLVSGLVFMALIFSPAALAQTGNDAINPLIFRLAVFVLAAFIGYYVVWAVTPALHTPLMSVTNAISAVVVVGAIVAAAASSLGTSDPEIVQKVWTAKWLGAGAVALACVNIFGGFMVTNRMLAMYKKKERPAAEKSASSSSN
ncbi:NAD(P) transhydrogenase subunit alpha [Hirschia baltica]|uniref:proton-translocating NAD(P)(+) transhydrogenase n=1 Tax=Hirschia baltica (strain ATCC 49814 / DSM 5838 / IFAM 1418) TaxID=582402 RepID=C6XR84_HIRBI|nr:NAD(P) transhydrogenase subunit alpha [Hirschia baltica]ACT60615.1 NAD/NADP transhydrogenase alpha subunit-like protein [Hirschia baltica ATCC 49814]